MDKRRNTTPAGRIAEQHTAPKEAVTLEREEIPRPRGGFESDEIRVQRLAAMNDFMSKQFTHMQNAPRTAVGRYEHQLAVDHNELTNINKPSRRDTFTLNLGERPEGFNTDQAEVLILDEHFFRQEGLIGKSVGEVLEYIKHEYGKDYFFPDIQDLYWMLLTGVVKEMSDQSKLYIFMGSNFCTAVGESNNVAALRFNKKGVRFFSYLGYREGSWTKENSVLLYKYK